MRTRAAHGWLALPAVAAAAAVWLSSGGCGGEAPGGPPPPEVLVATARTGSVPDRREYVGNVRAVNRVDVRARVRGYLAEQLYEDGQRVTEGDVLFRIDPTTYEVALAEAKGEQARARANHVRADSDFVRSQELFAAKVESDSILDQRRAERDASAALLAAAAAKVHAAELDLSYCTVRAPLSGRIGRALVDVGNLVGESGQDTVLAEIVQMDPIHVYFAPTELERLEVQRGAREGRIPKERVGNIPIELRLGDGSPYDQKGVVDYVDPTIEPTRGTITVRALVPNPDDELKPGEYVRVIAVFPDLPDTVLVPERAILDEQGGTYVLVVQQDGMVEYRRVVPGVVHEGLRQVREGLAAGERVIVDGVQKARPGIQVSAKPVEGDAPGAAAAPGQGAAG
jgi:membrane fusion protein (multidrug efflux system)